MRRDDYGSNTSQKGEMTLAGSEAMKGSQELTVLVGQGTFTCSKETLVLLIDLLTLRYSILAEQRNGQIGELSSPRSSSAPLDLDLNGVFLE